MSELAFGCVPASPLLLPATAEFGLIETQLPVVCTWTIAIWSGVLGNGGGRGSHPAVTGRGVGKRTRILALELPSHQLRGSKFARCITLRWVELVGKHGESGSTESSWRVQSRWELCEVIGEELLQRSSFAERCGVGGRMLVGRTEGLSLDSGNSRVLRHDHIVQLLGSTACEGRHRVCEVARVRYDILELLVKGASGLRLTE